MNNRRKLNEFIDESRTGQRNIVFPDTVRNARGVDVFLWRGSPNPTTLQRIAAWLFGIVFFGQGLLLLGMARFDERGNFWVGLASIPVLSLGVRIFRNGFPRHKKTAPISNRTTTL
jgi:hypothetical protein